MAADVPDFTPTTWVEGAAPGISAAQLQRYETALDALVDQYNLHNGGAIVTDHPEATPSVRGFFSAADKTILDAHEGGTATVNHPEATTVVRGFLSAVGKQKLDGISTAHEAGRNHPNATPSLDGFQSAADKTKLNTIETSAKDDLTAAQILALLLTVDGPGSGLNADLLDGIDSLSFVRDTGNETIAGIKTFTSVVKAPDGSVGAPGVRTGQDDWGLYRSGAYEGTTAAGSAVQVGNGINENYHGGVVVGGGVNLTISGTQIFKASSARRRKKNIAKAGSDYLGILDLIAAHTFDWKIDESPDRSHQYGHIADDVEDACVELGLDPELFVAYDQDNPQVPDKATGEETNNGDDEVRIQDRKDRALLSLALEAISDLRERVSELEGALA